MTFWISSSASTCTTALGYAPASRCERVVGVVGRLEFRQVVYPVQLAWCLATAPMTRQVPALTRPVAEQVCLFVEPEGQEDRRDYTAERAILIDATRSYSTTRGVASVPIIPT